MCAHLPSAFALTLHACKKVGYAGQFHFLFRYQILSKKSKIAAYLQDESMTSNKANFSGTNNSPKYQLTFVVLLLSTVVENGFIVLTPLPIEVRQERFRIQKCSHRRVSISISKKVTPFRLHKHAVFTPSSRADRLEPTRSGKQVR